jgi:hypothetical protein
MSALSQDGSSPILDMAKRRASGKVSLINADISRQADLYFKDHRGAPGPTDHGAVSIGISGRF